MSKHVMVVDYKYCTGCHACEVSCQNEKELPQDEWGIKVVEFGPKKLGGKWMWDYVPVPSDLCDLCEERRAAGKVPPCQMHCEALCLYVVPEEEAAAKAAELGDKVVTFRI